MKVYVSAGPSELMEFDGNREARNTTTNYRETLKSCPSTSLTRTHSSTSAGTHRRSSNTEGVHMSATRTLSTHSVPSPRQMIILNHCMGTVITVFML